MSEAGKGKNSGPISEKRRQSIIDGIRRKKLENNLGVLAHLVERFNGIE